MSTAGAQDLPLEIFGSYVPELPPASLPPGLSPWNQDCEYIRGGVKTRAGMVSQFPALPGNPTVNYLKSYSTPAMVLRMLALDSLGNVYKETPQGTLTSVIGTVTPGSYAKSTTCFGREYMAFGDGLNGIDIPRQYDDTNFDRVTQVGPGAPPTAADEGIAATITGAGANQPGTVAISSITEVGFIATVTTAAPHGLIAGAQNVQILGVTPTGYNGVFALNAANIIDATHFTYTAGQAGLAAAGAAGTIQSNLATYTTTAAHGLSQFQPVTITGVGVAGYNITNQPISTVPDSTHFTVALSVFGLAASGGGTVTSGGNVVAGVHQISVLFVTRQNYFTAPAPPAKWNAAGGKRVVVANIPIGPANVIARVIIFTAAGGANFYYTGSQSPITNGNMVIGDNTTTSIVLDFSDAVLLNGTNVDENFNLVELGECSGVIDYANRMFWWGERNKLQNFVNMPFDGGFASTGAPLGWTPDPATFTGGGSSGIAVWGGAYQIQGTGAALVGLITQSAFQDFRGIQIMAPAVAYSVRVRLANNPGGPAFTQGNFKIQIFSSGLGGAVGTFTVALTALTTSFTEFIGVLVTPITSIPTDLTLRVFADGTPTNLAQVAIDCIEIFPTNQPFNLSTVRASFNANNQNAALGQESYEGVTGLMQPQPFDGQGIRCMFKIREFLYVVKEKSLYVTKDDGINEPAFWNFRQVSLTVGTPSVNGVAVGEDWAVIANRSGLYMFNGSEPAKISQELQSNQGDLPLTFYWDNVNWAKGQFLWTVVDTLNKRILVGLPFAAATTPSAIFYLDYRALGDSEEIITGKPVHVGFSGKTVALENARKWSPWNMSINSAAIIERASGIGTLFLGNGAGNGKIFALSQTTFSDDPTGANTAINSFYTTYAFPSHEQEADFQMGSHKKDFTYLASYVEGSGLLSVSFFRENPATTAIVLASWTLDFPTARDHEQTLGGSITAERGFFQVGTNAVGTWFKITKFVPSIKPSVIPTRGVS